MNDFLGKRQATLRIVGIYALVGCLWIYTSDTVLGWLVKDPHIMVHIAIYKGSLFIVLTSLLLYFLVSRYNRNLAASEQALKDQLKSLQESETELKVTENKFQTLFESMTDGYAYVDMDGRIVEFNNAFCKMIGYTPEETRNLTYEDITPEKWRAVEREIVNSQVMVRNFSDIYEKEYRRKDGSVLPVELRSYLFSDGEGRPNGMWAIIRDVSERRLAEESLREAREFLETAVAQSPSGILIADAPDVKIRMANPAAFNIRGGNQRTLTGIDVAMHSAKWQTFRPDGSPYPSEQLPLSRAVLLGETVHNEEAIIRDEEGNDHWVSANAAPIRDIAGKVTAGIVVFHDITDRKLAEEERANMQKQLLHTQKLESLGILAGGIAHDFNNILTAIIGNADLALMRLNKESPAIDNLHRIEQAASRAAELAKQMLAYSGKGKFVVENLDLNRLMDEMLHMLEVSISKKAVLRLNLTHSLPLVEADATQIRQIVMNLVINASEAIDDKSGVIAITTGCKECDRSYLKNVWLDENLTDGLYVYLEIADSGCGMDKETLAKLFDPFFSTKFTGRGLGMAAVLGIVRGHKGSIKVYSEPGKGTTFKILLPASNRSPEIFNGDAKDDVWKGEGKVLLVDDEETVRSIGSEMLKELGFTPVTADDGLEALELFRSSPDIPFVILDLTMPHMDGEKCFRELRQIKPDVKVIMSSGFSENEVTQKFAGKGLAGFIQKPYKLSLLREVIMKIKE
jgi:PAS domain S-box-containing protein